MRADQFFSIDTVFIYKTHNHLFAFGILLKSNGYALQLLAYDKPFSGPSAKKCNQSIDLSYRH